MPRFDRFIRRSRMLSSAICVTLFAVSASAQCIQPDGLDGGPCCTDTQLQLPQFPRFEQESLNICWRDCDVESLDRCVARWSRPRQRLVIGAPPPCGQYFSVLRLVDTTGVLKWRGTMRLTYSRTWLEFDSAGVQYQVWRFLVNGDLRATSSAGPTPCPVPPCAAQFNNRVRQTGYVDYALNCGTNQFSFAWMLTHSCDAIDHAPGFPRGGFFHPNRTYTLVGPGPSFAVGPIQPVEAGGTALEGVRRLDLPTPGTVGVICEFEEFIDCGLEPIQELCLCASPNGPRQYVISDLGLASSCGTSIFTPGGPFLPGFTSMGIGMWTDPTAYPGLEILRWNCGGYDYFDPCVGVTRREVFFGVTTMRGFDSVQVLSSGPGLPLPSIFVDQGNSLRANAGTIMNVPFNSDHILNLNF